MAAHLEPAEDGLRAIAGPVAFSVVCAERDAHALLAAGAPTLITCSMELQDEQLTLVGFSNTERRGLYKGLRAISGIGRRSALTVLDCGDVLDILRAVAAADKAFFREVPGLGPKRIETLIGQLERRYKQSLPKPLDGPARWAVEARDALITEGVDADLADALVVAEIAGARSVEDLLARARAAARS